MDHGGPERSWFNTQHYGPTHTPGPLLDHLDPAWSTSCNHTPEIADQCGLRWTRGTKGTMELGVGPGVLWSHFYILLMQYSQLSRRTAKSLRLARMTFSCLFRAASGEDNWWNRVRHVSSWQVSELWVRARDGRKWWEQWGIIRVILNDDKMICLEV